VAEELSRITEEISRRASLEKEKILKEAERDISEREKEFREKKRKFLESSKDSFRKKGELWRNQIITEARMKGKKSVLRKKSELIDETFNKIIGILREKKGDDRGKLMEKLLELTVITGSEKVLPGSSEEGITPGLIKSLNSDRDWELELADKTDRVGEGFILSSGDSETVVDFKTLLEFLREKYEAEVVSGLFGSGK